MTAAAALDTAIRRHLNSGADRYVIKGHSLVDHCASLCIEVSEA